MEQTSRESELKVECKIICIQNNTHLQSAGKYSTLAGRNSCCSDHDTLKISNTSTVSVAHCVDT